MDFYVQNALTVAWVFMSKMPLQWHGFLCPKCPYCGTGFFKAKMPFIPSYLHTYGAGV